MQTIELVALSKVLGGAAQAQAPVQAEAPAGAATEQAAGQPTTERVALPGGGFKQISSWPGGQMIQISNGNGSFSFSCSFSSSQILGA